MPDFVCPLCSTRFSPASYSQNKTGNRDTCRWESSTEEPFVSYYCSHYKLRYAIEKQTFLTKYDKRRDNFLPMYGAEIIEPLLDLVLEHLIRHDYCQVGNEKHLWHFYYDPEETTKTHAPEYVNLARKLPDYPIQATDVAHRTLLNLSAIYPQFGYRFQPVVDSHRVYFEHNGGIPEIMGIIPLLEDFHYIKSEKNDGRYTITALGWQKIDELRKQEQTVRQGFVAMAFREEAKPIRESFRLAISAMGYQAVILDEKEHNNQIVPEIFYEIKRSKFVVVDVTYPNYGAYYEAGFAQALGKPVIICCQKQVYEDPTKRPHFDIAQQSIIVWENHEELIARLKRRIEATVT